MKNNLRAKKVREKEISDGVFSLTKNEPRIIDKSNNHHIALIHEHDKNTDEKLYVSSVFTEDDAFALVGREYRLNYYESAKALDFTYQYYGTNQRMIVYLYDLKKTLSGKEHVFKLIGQWKTGIATAKSCNILANAEENRYELSDKNIHLGVITEDNSEEKRKEELDFLMERQNVSEKVPKFVASQRKADVSSDIRSIMILKAFNEGYIEKDGVKYQYVIREFVDGEYRMTISDGKIV